MKTTIFMVLLVTLLTGAYGVVSSDLYWVWVMAMTQDTIHIFGLDDVWGVKLFAVAIGYIFPFATAILFWFFLENGFSGAEERARRKEVDARAIRLLAEQRRQELLASMRPPQRPAS